MPFSAEPAPGSPSYEAGYFVINAPPGGSVTETMRLENDSNAPVRLSIKPVDAATGPYGGVSYGLPNDPVRGVGTWISMPANEVDLAPGEVRNIAFTIKVPADAISGDHIVGLAVWQPKPAAGSAGIDTEVRRVLAVKVVIPGPAAPYLVINGVRPVVKPDGVYLEIGIASPGKLLTKGEGFIELLDNDFQRDFSVDTFVPWTEIDYPIKWIDNPKEGTYQAHVVIHYDQDQLKTEWRGSFTIGSALIAQEKAREGDQSHIMLYSILLAAGLVLAGVFITVRLRRRRRRAE